MNYQQTKPCPKCFRWIPVQSRICPLCKKELACPAKLDNRTRAQYLLENMIPYSWLGPEADGNMVASQAKKFVDALFSAGLLRCDDEAGK